MKIMFTVFLCSLCHHFVLVLTRSRSIYIPSSVDQVFTNGLDGHVRCWSPAGELLLKAFVSKSTV